MRALVNGKSVNYKGGMIINPQVHWQKGVNSMIVNTFLFLYLKLTRNSWNKELKWNYIYVLFAGREVRIGKTKKLREVLNSESTTTGK